MRGLSYRMNSKIDKQEYARLISQHAPKVIDFVSRMVSNHDEACEVAQEAFVKGFRLLATYRGEALFLTWMLRIAYHEALNHLHRHAHNTVELGDIQIADEPDDYELSTEREQRICLLEDAVADLPPDEQLLLHLYYYDNRTLRDIAYIMGAQPNALAVKLHRIRKKLLFMIKQRENENI